MHETERRQRTVSPGSTPTPPVQRRTLAQPRPSSTFQSRRLTVQMDMVPPARSLTPDLARSPVAAQRRAASPARQAAALSQEDGLAVQRSADRLAVQQQALEQSQAALAGRGLTPQPPHLLERQTPPAQAVPQPLIPIDRRERTKAAQQDTLAVLNRDARALPFHKCAELANHTIEAARTQGLDADALRQHLLTAVSDPMQRETLEGMFQRQDTGRLVASQKREDHTLLLNHAQVQRAAEQAQGEHDALSEHTALERVQARRGGGQPLPEDVRGQLELGLNHDLSAVRVHTDDEAGRIAISLHAVAFTSGKDIYFQAGEYNPVDKLELLAHEAAHIKQQDKGQGGLGVDPDAGLESEAQKFGEEFALGGSGGVTPKLRRNHKQVPAASTPVTAVPQVAVQRKTSPKPRAKPGKAWTKHFQAASASGPLTLDLSRAADGRLTGRYTLGKIGGPLTGMLMKDGDLFLQGQDGSKWHGRYTVANTVLFGNVTLPGGRLSNLELRSDTASGSKMEQQLISSLAEVMTSALIPKNLRKELSDTDVQTNVPLIMAECRRSGVTDPRSVAYVMVTASWESLMGGAMEESANGEPHLFFNRKYLNYNGNRLPDDGYRYRGRGFVQLTGRGNYARATQKLRQLKFLVDGRVPDLEQTPDLVSSNRALAAVVLVWGMQEGWFTGVGLNRATPHHTTAMMYPQGVLDPNEARWIVNGRDENSRPPMKTATDLLTTVLTKSGDQPLGGSQPKNGQPHQPLPGPSTPDDGADNGAIRIDAAAYGQVQMIPDGGYNKAERDRMIAGIETGSLDGVKGYFNGNVEAEDWGSNFVDGKYTGLEHLS